MRIFDDHELGVFDVPIEDYHRGPGISTSTLCKARQSMAHAKESIENPALAFMAGRIVEKQAQIGKNQRHLETLSKATGGRIGNV